MVRIIHCMIFIFAYLSCGYCLELQNCSTNQQWSQSNHEYLIKFSDNAKIITSDKRIELNDKTLPLWNSLDVKDNGQTYSFFRVPDDFPFYRITLNKVAEKRFYTFASYAIGLHPQEKLKTAGPEVGSYGIVMN